MDVMAGIRSKGILIIKELLIVAISAFIGVALLTITYLLSHDAMFENARASAITLYREELGHHIWEDAHETMLDVYTDGMIMNEAYTFGDDGITDIFLNPFMEVDGTNPANSLYEVAALANDHYLIKHYGRYWHGYLVIIRPLLLFFHYTDIRRLNMMLQIFLVVFFVWKAARSDDQRILIPFLGMYLFLSPVTLLGSLQYSPCFYVTMCMLIILLVWRERLNDTRRNYLFLLAGILTAYFDFLTYPFFTLGVPLLAYLGLERECLLSAKKAAKDTIFYTMSWGIGYVGMWGSKWILASLFTEENVILNALDQLAFRSGHFTSKKTMRETLWCIRQSINFKSLILMMVLLLGFIIVFSVKNHCSLKINMLPSLGILLLVSLYPFVWYYFTMHHSTDNSYFTWRELAISVFGILMIAAANPELKYEYEAKGADD